MEYERVSVVATLAPRRHCPYDCPGGYPACAVVSVECDRIPVLSTLALYNHSTPCTAERTTKGRPRVLYWGLC